MNTSGDMIEVNGITFYYNSNELNANDYINTLKSFIPYEVANLFDNWTDINSNRF